MTYQQPSAKVVAHSTLEGFPDVELITLEIELHRFILPEFNTHRTKSRNFQSSRAIPVLRQLEQIANNPAMPIWWGKDQAGMVAKEEVGEAERELAEMIILGMRDTCLNGVKQLQKLGLHKQIANRYVEPWMFTKGVVTSTKQGWEAFFKLRSHKDAQPEIKALSDAIKAAVIASTPVVLKEGMWHVPYVLNTIVGDKQKFFDSNNDELDLETAVVVSASCNAQVSYRRLDDSLEKAKKVYSMLNIDSFQNEDGEPPHATPTEHIARLGKNKYTFYSGNFNSNYITQYRKVLEAGEKVC